jgi:HEAT repeat protein
MDLAAISAAVLVVGNLVLIAVLVVRRWSVVARKRRHDALVTKLRRPAIELIESESTVPPVALSRDERAVFAQLLAHYSRQLRGSPRVRIAAYFEASGDIAEQTGRLSSGRVWRRATAAFALGDMGSARAVPDLLRGLDDRSRDVRMAAARSLGRIGATEAIGPLVAAGVDGRIPRDVANLALLDTGVAAVPELVALTQQPEPAVRASAVELIGLLGSASDADPILDLLTDPAASVRVAAAGALGRLGAGQARDALVRALEDRVPSVRVAAATALGGIGGRQASAALLPIARSDTFDAARAAAEALGRINPRLVIQAAAEPDAGPHLVEAADRALL